jgi:opacity protein-like surface antigen
MKKVLIILFIILPGFSIIYSQTNLTLSVGFQFPQSDFAQVASIGLGGGATIEFVQDINLSFDGAIYYYTWGPYSTYSGGPTDTYSDLQVMVGIRYHFNQNNVHPYAGIDVGFSSLYYDRTVSPNVYETNSQRFGVAPVLGLLVKINRRLNFDFNFRYNLTSSAKINGITFASNFYGLNFGLQFVL